MGLVKFEKNGKVVAVLREEDSCPQEVENLPDELLDKLGIARESKEKDEDVDD